jgi:hypothetical protein
MSKASEAAAAFSALKWKGVSGFANAWVSEGGLLEVSTGSGEFRRQITIAPQDALSLATWILDTFGEVKADE